MNKGLIEILYFYSKVFKYIFSYVEQKKLAVVTSMSIKIISLLLFIVPLKMIFIVANNTSKDYILLFDYKYYTSYDITTLFIALMFFLFSLYLVLELLLNKIKQNFLNKIKQKYERDTEVLVYIYEKCISSLSNFLIFLSIIIVLSLIDIKVFVFLLFSLLMLMILINIILSNNKLKNIITTHYNKVIESVTIIIFFFIFVIIIKSLDNEGGNILLSIITLLLSRKLLGIVKETFLNARFLILRKQKMENLK